MFQFPKRTGFLLFGDSEGYCQNMEIYFHNFPQTRMLRGNWQVRGDLEHMWEMGFITETSVRSGESKAPGTTGSENNRAVFLRAVLEKITFVILLSPKEGSDLSAWPNIWAESAEASVWGELQEIGHGRVEQYGEDMYVFIDTLLLRLPHKNLEAVNAKGLAQIQQISSDSQYLGNKVHCSLGMTVFFACSLCCARTFSVQVNL